MHVVHQTHVRHPLQICQQGAHRNFMEAQQTSLAAALRNQSIQSPDWQDLCDTFVARKRALSAGALAPTPGSEFPPLSLPDLHGRYQSLADLHAAGPIVVSFNRGGWCPYCQLELKSWSNALPALTAAGGALVVVAGVVGGQMSNLMPDQVIVLSDVDHGAALALGLAIHAGFDVLERYRQSGLDLAEHYGTASGFLPIPATFVIDQHGIVQYAFVNPDFRIRAEPADVIAVVQGLTGKG